MKKEDVIICNNGGEELYLKHLSKKFDYIITREKLTEGKNFKRQRREVINKMNRLAREKIDSNCYNYFADDHVIILWENIPKEGYLKDYVGYSEEHLLTTIARYLKKYHIAGKIFIESPLTLTKSSNPSYMEILQRLHLIWKESTIVPEFIESDFLLAMQNKGEFDEELQEYLKMRESRMLVVDVTESSKSSEDKERYVDYVKKDTMQRNETIFLRDRYKEHYERFFRTIDVLIEIIPDKVAPKTEANFIDIYLLWQEHLISGEEAVMLLPECSRANWYRYATAFEKSPVYENYACTYFSGAYIEPKRGHVPNAFELISYYNTIKDLEEHYTIPQKAVKRLLYDKFDEIYAINDSYRCLQAAMKTASIYRHKGVLKKKAAEYGLTEDIYDAEFVLWEPHKYED